jgi:hypothetical protein
MGSTQCHNSLKKYLPASRIFPASLTANYESRVRIKLKGGLGTKNGQYDTNVEVTGVVALSCVSPGYPEWVANPLVCHHHLARWVKAHGFVFRIA